LTHTLLVQTFLPLQVPQSSVVPQPSSMLPQVAPSASQVLGEQPHWWALPLPPQVAGAWQVPQWSVPLQPSGASPQSYPRPPHVAGVQGPGPHRFGPPAPQVSVALH
jgi:hypothetical protein